MIFKYCNSKVNSNKRGFLIGMLTVTVNVKNFKRIYPRNFIKSGTYSTSTYGMYIHYST
ncbi:hypothetical protein C2G38_2087096 [Gigaspora rosea]|uniref:Uncharacterized protein n=1 Tax=Gigaspora rosea TaxID=44941 RepID=A0A397V783_9GLOM|nr:hypothetical protein C2G38_2087096 [Gigaspora rosea]